MVMVIVRTSITFDGNRFFLESTNTKGKERDWSWSTENYIAINQITNAIKIKLDRDH